MSDRKYRHNGYQDSGFSKSSGPRTPRTPFEPRPERLEDAPRGRTAGGFGPEVFKCWKCSEVQTALGEIPDDAICRCEADLHVCKNCKSFDTGVRWECRRNEEIPARVPRKDLRNGCPLMAPRVVRDLSADKSRSAAPQVDDSRAAWDALFKK